MADYKKLESHIRKAFKQVSGSIKEEDGELLPEVAVICHGFVICYLPASRSFTKITCGTKAILITDKETETGRILIYTFDGQLVEIEKKYITVTGAD